MMKLDTYRYKKPHQKYVPKITSDISLIFKQSFCLWNDMFILKNKDFIWILYFKFTAKNYQLNQKMMWLNKLLQFCIIMSFFSKKKLIDLFVHNKPVYSYIHCSQNRTVLCHERAWNRNNKRIKQFTINPIEIHFHTILQRNNISEVKKND